MAETYELKRVALVAVVLLSNLLFSGLVFGWAPLLLMLQEENQYAELCEDPEDSCVEQENKLNLLFAAASMAANVGALPIGMFLDSFGPKITIAIAAVIEIMGLVLMALADSQTFDVFLPGYLLLAFGGSVTMVSACPSSFLILEYQTAILAAISCLFDGSSSVFLVLYSIRSTYGIERRELFFGLVGVAAFVYTLLIGLWHVNEDALKHAVAPVEAKPLLSEVVHLDSAEYETIEIRLDSSTSLAPVTLIDQPLRKQIMTFEYGYILTFALVQVLRANLYIGTANKLLDNYGDGEHEYLFTKIFSFVLPLGFLFIPVIDYVVEKKGLSVSLIATNLLGVIFNTLELIPNLPLQCITFFVFAGYRAFLYAITSAFAAKTFGLKNIGTLSGLMFTASALVSLLEYPAVYISNAYFDGDLSLVNSISLGLCIMLFPLTECYRSHQQVRRKKLQRLGEDEDEDNESPVTHGLTYLRSPVNYTKSPFKA
ncbi:hypothetical protein Poli38472_006455 [Pythium oligandrum]|uniref:Uncharacterized protein n=1 Tax=Pythium oligandrum TaxID=41045 RepID=A0A8K1FAP7_PYTOL|nr:hypothetical protein Poli38472_006455 [Pythium oligandrum]|eukprot:TMW56445.1 hypothetical protein Poli38472_006455 [Pythium oligandrum]